MQFYLPPSRLCSLMWCVGPSQIFLCLVYFSCSPCTCVYPKLKCSFFFPSVTVAFVLSCGEFCVFLCNLLLQLEERRALLLCPPPIDTLTVKCSLCLHRWPHQLGQSLMTHYTHINRTKHKQSSQIYCIRLHMQYSGGSQMPLSLFFSFSLSPPPLHPQRVWMRIEQTERYASVIFGNENGNWHQLGKPIK